MSPAEANREDLNVLVVDDEAHLRNLLSGVVRKMGCSVVGAASAEEAARVMTAEPRQVIILDLNLPGMQGMDFCEVVHQRWPKTQVIILTGFGDLDAAKRAIRAEVVDFLTKPFHLGDIEVALDRARRRLFPINTKPQLLIEPEPEEEALTARTEAHGEARTGVAGPAGSPTTLEAMERELILTVLKKHQGNRTSAAAELGISRRTLYNKLVTYGYGEEEGF
jgi:DNA-binding NtrC family response regulator